MESSQVHSLRAYARHRGVALRAVQVAIEMGRLHKSVVIVAGVRKIRDLALADEEWARNTDYSRVPPAVLERHVRFERERNNGQTGSAYFGVDDASEAEDGMVVVSWDPDPDEGDDNEVFERNPQRPLLFRLSRAEARHLGERLITASRG